MTRSSLAGTAFRRDASRDSTYVSAQAAPIDAFTVQLASRVSSTAVALPVPLEDPVAHATSATPHIRVLVRPASAVVPVTVTYEGDAVFVIRI